MVASSQSGRNAWTRRQPGVILSISSVLSAWRAKPDITLPGLHADGAVEPDVLAIHILVLDHEAYRIRKFHRVAEP